MLISINYCFILYRRIIKELVYDISIELAMKHLLDLEKALVFCNYGYAFASLAMN